MAPGLCHHDSLLFRHQTTEEQFQPNPFGNIFHDKFCQSFEISKQPEIKSL